MNTRLFLESLAALAALTLASRSALAAEAGEVKLAAQLLWGTNGDKPADKELRPVEAELDRRLRRIFKWKSYFEIERKVFSAAQGKPTKVEMSKECRLEVLNLAADEFEIQLFGRGKLVVKKRQRIVAGETVVLGGDDKNDDAWFVVLGAARPGETARP